MFRVSNLPLALSQAQADLRLEAQMPTVENVVNKCPRLVWAEVHIMGEDSSLIYTPRGAAFEVDAPAEYLHSLLMSCNGKRTVEELLRGLDNPERYAEVIQTLLEEEVLTLTKPIEGEADWVRFALNDVQPTRIRATRAWVYGDKALFSMFERLPLHHQFASVGFTSEITTLAQKIEQTSFPALALVLRLQLDASEMRILDEICERFEIPWSSFHLERGKGLLGPHIAPGHTANYRDLLMRRLTAGEYEQISRAELNAIPSMSYCPPEQELLWMLSLWLIDLGRWLAGAPCRMLSVEAETDPVSYSVKWHPVLPAPERQLRGELAISFPKDPSLLVDPRTGIISQYRVIEHHPSIPKRLVTIQTDVANMSRAYTWANNVVCSGSAFDDFQTARLAAIGESVERYSGNRVRMEGLLVASYNDILAAGEYAVDPDSLVLYSDRQYRSRGFPFVPFNRDSRVAWVDGWSLTQDVKAWIPASLVYVNWYTNEFTTEEPRHFLFYPGIAAGTSLEMALCSAIEEIIERDATMVWWVNRQALPSLCLTTDLEAIWYGEPYRLGQRAWAIYLENEFDFPVIAGVVENTQEHLLNIGFAARPDPYEATRKAWTEALTLQDGSRDLDEPNGLLRQAVRLGEFRDDALKPWRADRKYMDDFREDYRDVHDLMAQQQFFLDPRTIEHVRPWTETPAVRDYNRIPRLTERSSTLYRSIVERRGYEIFYANITSPDVSPSGLTVIRALIPGLAPNFPAAFPFLGRRRIQQAAVALGWRERALSEEELNYFPLPHA
jgi:ribosomal protein S12 methylthiotransferase accessory factor